MKTNSLRAFALAAVALVSLFAGARTASAIDIGISVGTPPPPPPPVVEQPWAPPYQGAVWIRPHNEWNGTAWVWVHGYYSYAPYPHGVWVEGRWRHGHWVTGHWRHR